MHAVAQQDSVTLCTDAGLPTRKSKAAIAGSSRSLKVYLGAATGVFTPAHGPRALGGRRAPPSRKYTAWLAAQPRGEAWMAAFALRGEGVSVHLGYSGAPPAGLPPQVRWTLPASGYLGPLNRRAMEQRRRNTPKERRKKALRYAAFLQHTTWSAAALARANPGVCTDKHGDATALESLPEEWWPHSVVAPPAPAPQPKPEPQPEPEPEPEPTASGDVEERTQVYPWGYDSLASDVGGRPRDGVVLVSEDEGSDDEEGGAVGARGGSAASASVAATTGDDVEDLRGEMHRDASYEADHDSDETQSEGGDSGEDSDSDRTLEEGDTEAYQGVLEDIQEGKGQGQEQGGALTDTDSVASHEVASKDAAAVKLLPVSRDERVASAGVAAVQLLPHWPLQAHEHCFSLQVSAIVRFAVRLSRADDAVWRVWEEATRNPNSGDQLLHSVATTAPMLPAWLKRLTMLHTPGVQGDQTQLVAVLGTMNASIKNLQRLCQIPDNARGTVGPVDMDLGPRLEQLLEEAAVTGGDAVVRGGGREALSRRKARRGPLDIRALWTQRVQWHFYSLLHLQEGTDERPALWAVQVPMGALGDAGGVENACAPVAAVREAGAPWAPCSQLTAAKLLCALARLIPMDRLMGKHTAAHHSMGSVLENTLEVLLGWPPVHALYEEVLGAPLVAAEGRADRVFDVGMLLAQLSMPMPAMLTTPCRGPSAGTDTSWGTRSQELLVGYAFRSAAARVSSLGQYSTPIASNVDTKGEPQLSLQLILSLMWPSYANNKQETHLACLDEGEAVTLLRYTLDIPYSALRAPQGEVWALRYAGVVTVPYVPRVGTPTVATAVKAVQNVAKGYTAAAQHAFVQLVTDAQAAATAAVDAATAHGAPPPASAQDVLSVDTSAPSDVLRNVEQVIHGMRALCADTADMAAAEDRRMAQHGEASLRAIQAAYNTRAGGAAQPGATISAARVHLQCAAASLALQHAQFAAADAQVLHVLHSGGVPPGVFAKFKAFASKVELAVPPEAAARMVEGRFATAVLPVFLPRAPRRPYDVHLFHLDYLVQRLQRKKEDPSSSSAAKAAAASDADKQHLAPAPSAPALVSLHKAWQQVPQFATMALPRVSTAVQAPCDRLVFYNRDTGITATPWCLFPDAAPYAWDVAVEDGTHGLSTMRAAAAAGVPVSAEGAFVPQDVLDAPAQASSASSTSFILSPAQLAQLDNLASAAADVAIVEQQQAAAPQAIAPAAAPVGAAVWEALGPLHGIHASVAARRAARNPPEPVAPLRLAPIPTPHAAPFMNVPGENFVDYRAPESPIRPPSPGAPSPAQRHMGDALGLTFGMDAPAQALSASGTSFVLSPAQLAQLDAMGGAPILAPQATPFMNVLGQHFVDDRAPESPIRPPSPGAPSPAQRHMGDALGLAFAMDREAAENERAIADGAQAQARRRQATARAEDQANLNDSVDLSMFESQGSGQDVELGGAFLGDQEWLAQHAALFDAAYDGTDG